MADLNPYVSVWPRLELGYGTKATKQTSVEGTNEHAMTRSWVRLSAPVLVHGTSHFFVGAGPYIFYELADSDQSGYENRATELGVSLLLGGWL